MNLRDIYGPLEAALERVRALPAAHRPCVVVSAHSAKSGVFVQYYGSADAELRVMVCYNDETSQIEGFGEAAREFFGGEMKVNEGDGFGSWEKACPSVTRAVELGMQALRHVLMLGWDTELFLEEIVKNREGWFKS